MVKRYGLSICVARKTHKNTKKKNDSIFAHILANLLGNLSFFAKAVSPSAINACDNVVSLLNFMP